MASNSFDFAKPGTIIGARNGRKMTSAYGGWFFRWVLTNKTGHAASRRAGGVSLPVVQWSQIDMAQIDMALRAFSCRRLTGTLTRRARQGTPCPFCLSKPIRDVRSWQSIAEVFFRPFLAVLAALLICADCQIAAAAPPRAGKRQANAGTPDAAVGVKLVRVPDGGIQPQAAVDTEGVLHLIYFVDDPAAGNVYYVRKSPRADRFSDPLRVNSQPRSAIAVGSIRGAQLALGKANRVHVAWNGSGKAEPKVDVKYGSPMLYTRLADDGNAFEPQRMVNREAFLLDGGGSVAADREGNVYVVWHSGDGEANRRVWVARSTDDGGTFASEVPVDSDKDGACGCCGLKAFADREGTLYVLYRSARESTNRDMVLLTSTDHGKAFGAELADRWPIDVCPMSSEAFVDTAAAVAGAWETDGNVFLSRIDKKGHRLSKAVAPSAAGGGRKHPALAVNRRGETILVWTEGTGWQRGGALAWQVFDAQGKPTETKGRTDGIAVWSFAAVYADPADAFVILY